MKDPAEIRLDHDAPVLVRHAGDQTVACHAGVVDENVEFAHPVDQCLRPFRIGDVGLDGACPCFASDLDHLVRAPVALWVHGHTHESLDYTVNGTRVFCNPRGYLPMLAMFAVLSLFGLKSSG
jgi:hypothetical protein